MSFLLRSSLLIFLFPSILLANDKQSSPYIAQLSGDHTALISTLPSRSRVTRASLTEPIAIRLKAGKRVFRVQFEEVNQANWRSYLDNGFFRAKDPTELTLLLGKAEYRGETITAGGTLSRRHGRTELKIYFQPPSFKSPKLLYARIPLTAKTARGVFSLRSIKLPHDGGCGTEHGDSPEKLALSVPDTLPLETQLFEIAADADAQFYAVHGEDTSAVIATIINQLNVVYGSELGLRAQIVEQNTFTNPASQPYTTTAASPLLDQFQAYRVNTDPFLRYDVGHLFTGKDLNGGTLGIAAVGPVCRSLTESFGLSQNLSTVAATTVVVMHEIGHNFNAQHSTSGIMVASASSPLPTSFSPESISQITSFIANNGNCLGECVGCPPPDTLDPFEDGLAAINEILPLLDAVPIPSNDATPEQIQQYQDSITAIELIWSERGSVLLGHFTKKLKNTAKKVGKTFPKAKSAKKSKSKEKKIAKISKLLNKILELS